MGLVQCFIVILTFSARLVLSSPTGQNQYYPSGGNNCKMCRAGMYLESCTECKPCPTGSYTSKFNQEDQCKRCSGDCRPEFHLKVVQNCTSTSNVECVCQAGFKCTTWVPLSSNCRYCEKMEETTTVEAAAIILDQDKHTPSPVSAGHSGTSAQPCQFPKCARQSVPATAANGTRSQTNKTNSQLATILVCLSVIGCVALIVLFSLLRPKQESCFKQALRVCSREGRDASLKSKESTQIPRDSSDAKESPSSLSAVNLGSVHVHNPGTVILSLLSQFTGQVGPTIEGGKTVQMGSDEEDNSRECPVFHPASSPSIHFSEEERSQETEECIFFPSQEQGKDCHVSKEEVL